MSDDNQICNWIEEFIHLKTIGKYISDCEEETLLARHEVEDFKFCPFCGKFIHVKSLEQIDNELNN